MEKREHTMANLQEASTQWRNRPDDQRFETLLDLYNSVESRRRDSWTFAQPIERIGVTENMEVELYNANTGLEVRCTPTNKAFQQLCHYAQVPYGYAKDIDPKLTQINLQWGLDFRPKSPEGLFLGETSMDQDSPNLRAITSTSYGRIWDSDVVQSVMQVNQADRWQVPSASYTITNPKRATTLYASDRDVFIFLVDPHNPVHVEGETLFRGFMVWNSEVGSATFGLKTFLYRTVCDNRIIWGATNVQQLKIRHTSGAPDRFRMEGTQALAQYASESTLDIENGIKKAKQYELRTSQKEEGWEGWLKSRGFDKHEINNAISYAEAEEGEARSGWDIVNGLTASARAISHTNARVALESKAGRLMEEFAR